MWSWINKQLLIDKDPSVEEIAPSQKLFGKPVMKSKKKTFGATKLMSEQSNQISKNVMDLRSEEIIAYFDKK